MESLRWTSVVFGKSECLRMNKQKWVGICYHSYESIIGWTCKCMSVGVGRTFNRLPYWILCSAFLISGFFLANLLVFGCSFFSDSRSIHWCDACALGVQRHITFGIYNTSIQNKVKRVARPTTGPAQKVLFFLLLIFVCLAGSVILYACACVCMCVCVQAGWSVYSVISSVIVGRRLILLFVVIIIRYIHIWRIVIWAIWRKVSLLISVNLLFVAVKNQRIWLQMYGLLQVWQFFNIGTDEIYWVTRKEKERKKWYKYITNQQTTNI